MKTFDLISNLRRYPSEFGDRLAAVLSVRWESSFYKIPQYSAVALEEGMDFLHGTQGRDFGESLSDLALTQIEKHIVGRLGELSGNAPFGKFHNGDMRLGRLCYAMTRAIRPSVVIETGVCYGVTSAYLLAALDANGEGHLYSIDLPPLGKNGEDYVGWLVPKELQKRWTLRRGASQRILGPLIAELGSVDIFIHDSLHTYKNMKHEFETAWPALRSGGVLIADDIEGNAAFLQLAQSKDLDRSIVIREKNKDALLGVAVKRE
ncbi:MAG TPA: class I SAM-dependent methyltransferase [Candidatus Acidoferrales bacterium]|jgi:predicted O-methyltransferase YrrM|nr:class I SAM-dependent methyltransferase [Candidatus Acidoferrales bacterium]